MRTRIVWVALGLSAALALASLVTGWWIGRQPRQVYGGFSAAGWEAEIGRWEAVVIVQISLSTQHRIWARRKPWSWLIRYESAYDIQPMPLHAGDRTAIPILIELLRSRNPQARLIAAEGLMEIGEEARDAISAVLLALDDPDAQVREQAQCTLIRLDRAAAERAGLVWKKQ